MIDQELYPKPEWAVRQIVRVSGLIENVCCHGVGHPHEASVKEFDERGVLDMGIHGCDGCCCDEETKEMIKKELKEYYDNVGK